MKYVITFLLFATLSYGTIAQNASKEAKSESSTGNIHKPTAEPQLQRMESLRSEDNVSSKDSTKTPQPARTAIVDQNAEKNKKNKPRK
jgi:hypothetical protein